MSITPIALFWRRAAAAAGLDPSTAVPEAWSFADTPALADGLLGAVISGVKTGTSTSLAELEADGSRFRRWASCPSCWTAPASPAR